MTTQGAVFITSTSIYNDVVAKTIGKYSSSKTTIVNYEGQSYGREDFKLTSLVKRNKPVKQGKDSVLPIYAFNNPRHGKYKHICLV